MATVTIVKMDKEFTWTFAFQNDAPGFNCGMQWLTNISLTKKKSTYDKNRWDDQFTALSLEEAFKWWDDNKEEILKKIIEAGGAYKYPKAFYMIADSINVNYNPFWNEKWIGTTVLKKGSTKTVHFMNWVQSRQIGLLVRGPIGNNLAHTGEEYTKGQGRSSVGWFWQPFPETMVDPTVKILCGADAKPNPLIPSVIENAKEYTDFEDTLYPKAA